MKHIDTRITELLNGLLFRHDLIEDPVLFYERLSIAVFVAVILVLFIGGVRSGSVWKLRTAVSAMVASGVAMVAAHFISIIAGRPRPFIAHPDAIHTFASHSADAGFPSDHATASFAIATAILLRDRRWGAVVVALASLLAVGRVACGVHYPTDVLAGAVLGASSALLISIAPIRTALDRFADSFQWRPTAAALPSSGTRAQ